HPVEGPRMARTLNIDGDGQGDLGGHGGEQRAVMVYQRQSYDYWRDELGRDDLEYGNFGENFTVDGLLDDEVHIGDRYRIGDAEIDALLYLPNRDVAQLRKAVDIPALSPGWRASFRDLLTPKEPLVDGWPGFRPLRVSRIVPESTTIASIHLSTPDGSPLPRP